MEVNNSPTIFTMTASADLFKDNTNYVINLPNIYMKNELTDKIIGIKYNWMNQDFMKGTYSTTIYKKSKSKKVSKINVKSFYNQMSFVVRSSETKQVNVKLFGNGKLQMTGCKEINDAVKSVTIIRDYLNSMVDDKKIVQLKFNNDGILMDGNNLVYSNTTSPIIIGWFDVESKEYLIDKKKCIFDENLGLFVTVKTFQSRSRLIYDMTGKHVGDMSIELLRNKKKLYSKFTDIQIINDLVYVNNKIVIGKNNVTICDDAVRVNKENALKEMTFEMSESPYLDFEMHNINQKLDSNYTEKDIDIYSIMANYKIGYQINRQKLCDFLQNQDYLVKYNPETYSGLYVMFKYKTMSMNEKQDGKCVCSAKCTCSAVSIIVFQSGNIIFSGAKNSIQLNEVFGYFVKLLNENSYFLKKKELI